VTNIDLIVRHQARVEPRAQVRFVDVNPDEDKLLPPIPVGVIRAVEDALPLP
jgi:hypothetical protein